MVPATHKTLANLWSGRESKDGVKTNPRRSWAKTKWKIPVEMCRWSNRFKRCLDHNWWLSLSIVIEKPASFIMKKQNNLLLGALLLLSACSSQLFNAHAQGTAFTYQGQLQNGGSPASGTYNLTFTLFSTSNAGVPVAGPLTNTAVVITNGLFTVLIDFGPGVFAGQTNWLQIGVETNGGPGFTSLNPRQEVTPAPYALYAEAANAAGLSGTIPVSSLSGSYGEALNLSNAGNTFTGNGTGLTNVNATTLGGVAAAAFWQLGGNTNVPAGSNVIGTLDNQFLDVRVSNVRVLRLRLFTDGQGLYTNAPNVIGGSSVNLTAPNVVGATIAGGGGNGTNGNALLNEVYADFGTVGGGANNTAGSQGATVSGGFGNIATNAYATAVGGVNNNASGFGSFIGGGGFDGSGTMGNTANGPASVIGGGMNNQVSGSYATVAGGLGNVASSGASTIGGGTGNSVGGYGFATVGGGYGNNAGGIGSFVGGGGTDGISPSGNHAQGATATIGGGLGNNIPSGGAYAVIGGGYSNTNSGTGSFIGGGGFDGTTVFGNSINDNAATIGGGLANSIPAGGAYSFIGGGSGNVSSNLYTTIGGGFGNLASGNGATIGGGGTFGGGNMAVGQYSTVGGGTGNNASSGYAVVGGGQQNLAGGVAFVGGGFLNNATGIYAAIPGGRLNTASGQESFAGGYFADANHDNCFVWSDGEGSTNFPADRANQFKVQAGGGVYLAVSGSSGLNPAALEVNSTSANGVALYAQMVSSDATAVFGNGGTGDIIKGFSGPSQGTLAFEVQNDGTVKSKGVVLTSDRNAKANFTALNPAEVLAKVAALPVTEWNYKDDPADKRHIGPVAQDFHAAFGLDGNDDKHISVVDEGGVALAAIQGLNQKLVDKDSNIQKQSAEIADLKARLDKLEQLMTGKLGVTK